jgi:plastocyanin
MCAAVQRLTSASAAPACSCVTIRSGSLTDSGVPPPLFVIVAWFPTASETRGGDRAWREWMTIGMGLTGLLSILSTIVAVVANPGTQPGPRASMSTMMASSATPASTAPAAKAEAVKLTIKSDDEHGRRGPDGKWHDAYLPANFTVHSGDKVTVTVYNYDTGSHTFTSPTLSAAGLINEMIPAGTENAPHKTTFTFTAPSQTGKYLWWCAMPCDPWAMTHIGYMRGYVTVVA